MNGNKICRTLSNMMPTGVCVTAGPAVATPLTARESASLGNADVTRISEFESGRSYAKQALALLGVHNVDLPVGPNRAPIWPIGVVGSITHTGIGARGGYVAAAVARDDKIAAIGIDFEMGLNVHPHLWTHVFTSSELRRILALPVETRRTEAQYIWCAKEATVKVVKARFDPSKIEVKRDKTNGEFVATCYDDEGSRSLVLGRTSLLNELFIATATLSH